MSWEVCFSRQAGKQLQELNERIRSVVRLLACDLKEKGPAPGSQWPNYGKLHTGKNDDKRHCHLIKGRPTYVCCWKVYKIEKYIEVYYVGTHERAPY